MSPDRSPAIATILLGITLLCIPAARPCAAPTSGAIDVTSSGADRTGATDSTNAFCKAINQVNSATTTSTPPLYQAYLYIPAGVYLLNPTSTPANCNSATALNEFTHNGSIMGDGPHKTYIQLGSAYAGDLFSWNGVGQNNAFLGPSVNPGADRSGPYVEGLTILGTEFSGPIQNALMFYDQADSILVRDVEVFFLNGRCLAGGLTQASVNALAYLRESKFYHLKCVGTGSTVAYTFTATPNGTSTIAVAAGSTPPPVGSVLVGSSNTNTVVPDGAVVTAVSGQNVTLSEAVPAASAFVMNAEGIGAVASTTAGSSSLPVGTGSLASGQRVYAEALQQSTRVTAATGSSLTLSLPAPFTCSAMQLYIEGIPLTGATTAGSSTITLAAPVPPLPTVPSATAPVPIYGLILPNGDPVVTVSGSTGALEFPAVSTCANLPINVQGIAFTAVLNSGPTQLSNVSLPSGQVLGPGMTLVGFGMQPNTTIVSTSGTTLNISQAVSSTSSTPKSIVALPMPSVEFASSPTSATTDEIDFYGVDITRTNTAGLVIQNGSTAGQTSAGLRFFGLRVENGVVGDLLSIGSDLQYDSGGSGGSVIKSPYPGSIGPMTISGFLGNGATVFSSTIGLHGPATMAGPTGIHIQGSINTGQGPGINLADGTEISVDTATIRPSPSVLVSSVGSGLVFSPSAAYDLTVNPPNPVVNLNDQFQVQTPLMLNGQVTLQPGTGTYYMKASGTGSTSAATTLRLTADGTPANASNCLNLPKLTTANLAIHLSVVDRDSAKDSYSATLPLATLIHSNATTTLTTDTTHGPLIAATASTTLTYGTSITADATSSCLNLTVTLPTTADRFLAYANIEYTIAH